VFLPVQAANTVITYYNDQISNTLPDLHHQSSLTLCWFSYPGWGRECISLLFYYIGSQYMKNLQWHTSFNILQLAVGYLNVAISRQTWKPEPGIGTDVSSQPRKYPHVDGYGSGFGFPGCCMLGLRINPELYWPVIAFQTWTAGGLPGPATNSIPMSLEPHVAYQPICYGSLSQEQCLMSYLLRKVIFAGGNKLPPHHKVSLGMYSHVGSVWDYRCTWKPYWSMLGDALADHFSVSAEIHLDPMIWSTWELHLEVIQL